MQRWSFFAYGVFCHLLFLATYAYMAGFVGNFIVPKSLDSDPAEGPGAVAEMVLVERAAAVLSWGPRFGRPDDLEQARIRADVHRAHPKLKAVAFVETAVDERHMQSDVLEDVRQHVLLHGVVERDMLAEVLVDLVPGPADLRT